MSRNPIFIAIRQGATEAASDFLTPTARLLRWMGKCIRAAFA